MEEVEGQSIMCDLDNKYSAKFKIRVFISSICNDNGKYDRVRAALKTGIESTGLADVYLFGDNPKTTSAENDYIWNVEDSDLCIFIIDNKDGIRDGVQKEIDAANKNNTKSIYYFCRQFSKEPTKLQKELTGPGKPKFHEIDSFEELLNKGTQDLIDEIVSTYHHYCKGRLIEYNGEIEISSSGADISDLGQIDKKFLPKVSLKNLDKSRDYIILKTIGKRNHGNYENAEKTESVLDNYEHIFLEILMGEKKIEEFPIAVFLEELEKIQDSEYISIVRLRWEAINKYFNGDILSCINMIEEALILAEEKAAPTWVIQDILIDIRNIRVLKGNIDNCYDFEAQNKLDEIEEQFHYPVMDRIKSTIEEKYIKGMYKKKMDSPHSVHFGSDIAEYGELFASELMVAMYNGSLTHIRLFYDRIREFMFYLAEKYSDWIVRKNLLKFAVVSSEEKEINQIVEAYPEILNKLNAEESKEIISFSETQPIKFDEFRTKLKAFGVIGYYLSDDDYSKYEEEIIDGIFEILKKDSAPNLLGIEIFRNLKKIIYRLNSDKIIEICLIVIKKGYSAWYLDMYKLLNLVDFETVSEELRKRLILAFEELLYEEGAGNFLLNGGILEHIRNSDRNNTERMDSIIKEKYPQYYNDSYLVNTCEDNSQIIVDFVEELKSSIINRNKTQGQNGLYFGYARSDYASLQIIFDKYYMPDDRILKEFLQLAKSTICESKESIIKLEAVNFIISLLGQRKDLFGWYESAIDEMYEKRDALEKDKRFFLSNIEPIAIEFGVVLLKSMLSNDDDKYYEIIEILATVNEDLATKIAILGVLKKFYKYNEASLSKRIETALLSNVLHWLNDDNLEIRLNACSILFGLSRNFAESGLMECKINELMSSDGLYTKLLVMNNLENININEDSKRAIIQKACTDNCYLVREKASEKMLYG